MTQADRIHQHMIDYGSITSLEAFQEYGCTRLSAWIHDLRKSGVRITSEDITLQNRYGEPVHFARYSLAD